MQGKNKDENKQGITFSKEDCQSLPKTNEEEKERPGEIICLMSPVKELFYFLIGEREKETLICCSIY